MANCGRTHSGIRCAAIRVLRKSSPRSRQRKFLPDHFMNPRNFFAELKRRNVYKVAIAYAIIGWLVMQVGNFARSKKSLSAASVEICISDSLQIGQNVMSEETPPRAA
jgi:hypothetical protein